MSDIQSLVFQEVDEPQTARAVEYPVGNRSSTHPPLQPNSAPRGVSAQPLVAIKPKRKIITTTAAASTHSEDSIQFIPVPSRGGPTPMSPKPKEAASPPPRMATAPQRPRVAPRSAADSVHSVGSSILFNVDDSIAFSSPAPKHNHSGSDRDSHHYYSSHANRASPSSRPPLTDTGGRGSRRHSTQSDDVEESIAFQDAAESSHSSLANGHGVPNDSIAFQIADDDSVGAGLPGASQSFPRVFRPLRTTPHNARSPEESLAFDVEETGASWSRGPSPRNPPQPARSPSPQFLNNDSIAFQIEDSVPRYVEHHAQPPSPRSPPMPTATTSAAGTATNSHHQRNAAAAALSPDSDGQDSQSMVFQFDDSSIADLPATPSPLETASPRNEDPSSPADGEHPAKAKKTVVSNRLQKLSRSSSPAKPRGSLQSPPPSTVTPPALASDDVPGKDKAAGAGKPSRRKHRSSTTKDSTSSVATPQSGVDGAGVVDMPKKRRHHSKSTDKKRSSRSDSTHKHKHRSHRSTGEAAEAAPEQASAATAHKPEEPTGRPRNKPRDKSTDSSGASNHSAATTKTETDMPDGGTPTLGSFAAIPGARQETTSFHSRNNSSTIVVHHLREQESKNTFHQQAYRHQQQQQQQQQSSVAGSESDISRSLLHDDAYRQHYMHNRNETAVYHGGGGGGGNSGVFASPSGPAPGDVARASEEAAYWSAFNASQRQELEQLQHRIRAARRQDKTLLERSLAEPAAATAAASRPASGPQPGGYATATGSQTTFRWKQGTPVGTTTTTPTTTQATTRRSDPAQLSSPIPQQRVTTTRRARSPETRNTAAQAPQRRNGAGKAAARNTDQADMARAQEAVAHMLGLLWPPGRPQELYFLSGTRLTPLQVQRFYETAAVQKATTTSAEDAAATVLPGRRSASRAKDRASRRQRLAYMSPAQLRRSASPDGCVSSAAASETSASPLPIHATNRKTVKRSQVLRDVFNVMDLTKSGLLYSKDLGTLHHLLEQELVSLEAQMGNGVFGEGSRKSGDQDAGPVHGTRRPGPPFTGLMATAAQQRELYEAAWQGLSRDVAILDAASTAASDASFVSTRAELVQQAALQRQALRLSLAVNVLVPLCRTSGIGALDFPTVSLLVFTALDRANAQSTPQGTAWRDIVSQYFVMLS